MSLVDEAVRDGVLDRRIHEQMILRLEAVAERAGVPVEAICRPLARYAGRQEAEWCRQVIRRRNGTLPPGLAYVGAWRDVDRRMEGLAGALVRNFVDARVMTASQVLDGEPDCLVLLVPHLSAGTDLKAALLADALVGRFHAGRATVLHVQSLDQVGARFGASLRDVVGQLEVRGR